ncbi:MAG: DUF501 domain-containing protein [Synergistaceae bacterium]|nr:DUF501 domain-containing protein [Synergistaceae bacterium]
MPAFWTSLTEEDISLLKERNRRRRFDISIIFAVAARCSFGYPQVLVCRQRRKGGAPFPTLFWLTCPFLDRKCGELESLQKISELEELFRYRKTEISYWHERYAFLRKNVSEEDADISTGVGGINWQDAPHAVKCLHLQVATWLGWRYHPAADWLKEQLEETECGCGICGKTVDNH